MIVLVFIKFYIEVIIDTLVQLKPYFKQDVLLVNLSKGLFVGGVTIVESIREALNTRMECWWLW